MKEQAGSAQRPAGPDTADHGPRGLLRHIAGSRHPAQAVPPRPRSRQGREIGKQRARRHALPRPCDVGCVPRQRCDPAASDAIGPQAVEDCRRHGHWRCSWHRQDHQPARSAAFPRRPCARTGRAAASAQHAARYPWQDPPAMMMSTWQGPGRHPAPAQSARRLRCHGFMLNRP